MKVKKILKIAWIFWTICFVFFVIVAVLSVTRSTQFSQQTNEYSLPWPGILPDNKLYKVKVLRNKIIEKMIIAPVKKVEFDLHMADKTIYASQLLMEKGEVDLAKETALKGENYFSMLVNDYNTTLLKRGEIPDWLDRNITHAVKKHQKIFAQLKNKASGEDKKTFQVVNDFSRINYNFILEFRSKKK